MAKKNKGINIFQHVPKANPNRTQFPINHKCDFDGDFGLAYPVFCQEVLPGDTWHISADHFSRLAPMIAPVYHDFNVKFHWFFVPMRLLWDDFEDWMTGGKNGTWREDNPDSFPLFDLSRLFEVTTDIIGTMFDFMGVNTCTDGATEDGLPASKIVVEGSTLPVMPIRGYWMIYNYFFRDQNITEEVPVTTSSGLENVDDFLEMLRMTSYDQLGNMNYFFAVSWDKDYFTSATLSPQRGPQVFIPLGNSAPLVASTDRVANIDFNPNLQGTLVQSAGTSTGLVSVSAGMQSVPSGGTSGSLYVDGGSAKISASNFATNVQQLTDVMSADLAAADGAAVDDVREAFSLQRFFERMQLVGSRFSEFLRGIWGTNAGDARLQMPEYLGTWVNPFMINNVSNTTGTSTNPQGGYAGNGMATQYNKPIHKNFPEFGYLYCLYTALPRPGYQQGLAPIFCRRDWLHFANPYFEHIGEQPIEIEELYYDPSKTRAENEETFGYQSQYANYKFINSHSHGTFKTNLNFWHANRVFQSAPTLSDEFISFNPAESTNRVFVITEGSKFYTTIQFDGYVERNLSAFSTPRLM